MQVRRKICSSTFWRNKFAKFLKKKVSRPCTVAEICHHNNGALVKPLRLPHWSNS